MKKTTISMIVALLVCSSVYAIDPDKFVINTNTVYLTKTEDNKFVLYADAHQQVDVKIYADNGREVYRDKISHKKGAFKKVYDFSKQEPGQYVFEIQADHNKVKQDVFYSDLHLKDLAAQISVVEDGVVKLKVRHQNTPVTIEIKDQDGRVLHRDKYLKKSNFVQQIDVRDYSNKDLFLTVSGKKTVISFIL